MKDKDYEQTQKILMEEISVLNAMALAIPYRLKTMELAQKTVNQLIEDDRGRFQAPDGVNKELKQIACDCLHDLKDKGFGTEVIDFAMHLCCMAGQMNKFRAAAAVSEVIGKKLKEIENHIVDGMGEHECTGCGECEEEAPSKEELN